MLSPLYITPEGYFKGDIMMAFLTPRGEGGIPGPLSGLRIRGALRLLGRSPVDFTRALKYQ
jgi:hypothetical protein